MDLCGPCTIEARGEEKYFMLIIEDNSILTWVTFLRNKLEAFEKFKIFRALGEN